MDHSYERHISFLNELCRTCGKKNVTEKQKKNYIKPRSCAAIAGDIMLVHGVDIEKDKEDTHSKYICHKCILNINAIKSRQSLVSLKTARGRTDSSRDIWCAFDGHKDLHHCSVCSHRLSFIPACIKRSSSAGQPSSPSATNSPCPSTSDFEMQIASSSTSNLDTTVMEVHSQPSPTNEQPPIPANNQSSLTAISSSNILSTAPLAFSTPIKPTKPNTSDSTTSPMIKQMETLTYSINQSVDQPLTKQEESAYTSLTKRKLYTDPNKRLARCKTGGQPIILQRIVKPRKHTSQARTPTKKRRVRLMKSVRTHVAGSSKEAEDTQFSSELKIMSSARRQEVLKKTGVKQKIKISQTHTLAMKEALGLSWRQQQLHGRLLKAEGVQLENEKSIRKLCQAIVGDFVKAESAVFVNANEEDFSVVYSRLQKWPAFVDRLLNAYETKNLLTWHQGLIPDDEVWVKIGADHGKSSLKLTLQIANTSKPNSRTNTVVLGQAAVMDSHENLVRFLNNGLLDELNSLMSHFWKEKKIIVILNGDYKFFTEVFGLSGATGTFPCLWCLMPKRKINSVCPPFPQRTLASLHFDHLEFMSKHKGDKKQAAKHNNSVHAPLLPIQLESVCPPYLHILLGIVLKHHKLLESEAHAIDLKIASQPDYYLTDLGLELKRYGGHWKNAVDTRTKLEFLQGCLAFSETETDKTKYVQEIEATETLLSHLQHKKLDPRSGPVASCLDPILHTHRIRPQAYHSRSFVGNHCHKYITLAVYKQLTQAIITRTQACTRSQDILDRTYLIEMDFNSLNDNFFIVHKQISHARPIRQDSLPAIQTAIDTYMSVYRQLFTNKTIPKQHILEHHCVPYIQRCGFGLGFLGEQGTENVHQDISKIEQRARGITNETHKQEFISKTNLLQIEPSLRAEYAAPRKRKSVGKLELE